MDGEIYYPLTRQEAFTLLNHAEGKVRVLVAIGFGMGISIDEAHGLLSTQIGKEAHIGNRRVIIPEFVRKELKPFRNINGMIFSGSTLAMGQAVLKATFEILGKQRSYKALRRTFVRLCAEKHIPLELVIDNVGDGAEFVHPIYRSFSDLNPEPLEKL